MKGAAAYALVALSFAFASGGEARAEPVGQLEIRVTDHRPGIADFKWLEVGIGSVAVHPRGEGRRSGWRDVLADAPPVDVVPLKNGVWRRLGEATVSAGDYDALRIRFAHAEGELLNGDRLAVPAEDATIRLDLTIRADAEERVVIDLFAEARNEVVPENRTGG